MLAQDRIWTVQQKPEIVLVVIGGSGVRSAQITGPSRRSGA